jgi:hypothetical protein
MVDDPAFLIRFLAVVDGQNALSRQHGLEDEDKPPLSAGRIAEIHSGSSLFTGGRPAKARAICGGTSSNAISWDAIIQLPEEALLQTRAIGHVHLGPSPITRARATGRAKSSSSTLSSWFYSASEETLARRTAISRQRDIERIISTYLAFEEDRKVPRSSPMRDFGLSQGQGRAPTPAASRAEQRGGLRALRFRFLAIRSSGRKLYGPVSADDLFTSFLDDSLEGRGSTWDARPMRMRRDTGLSSQGPRKRLPR